ncbi:MAG TPA: PAS domain S-box protein, partial [Candidatus Eisenbacteria bacterium]|nr:PAS domain S-box protein [Candidatus Eisenbacteria bacterium]
MSITLSLMPKADRTVNQGHPWIDFCRSKFRAHIPSTLGRLTSISRIEASAQLAAIVKSSDDAIISKTSNGIITSWNPAAEKLYGYTETEAIGKRMADFFPPERREEEEDILNRIARGETIDHF